MLEVYLVRHGKTVFNTIGRLQGWSDSPLTNEGRAAAAALGCRIGKREIAFDAAFSSTAPRAAETAGLILQQAGQGGLAVRQLPDLREYCFGGFSDGLPPCGSAFAGGSRRGSRSSGFGGKRGTVYRPHPTGP